MLIPVGRIVALSRYPFRFIGLAVEELLPKKYRQCWEVYTIDDVVIVVAMVVVLVVVFAIAAAAARFQFRGLEGVEGSLLF